MCNYSVYNNIAWSFIKICMYDVGSKQADQQFPVRDQYSGIVLYCILSCAILITGHYLTLCNFDHWTPPYPWQFWALDIILSFVILIIWHHLILCNFDHFTSSYPLYCWSIVVGFSWPVSSPPMTGNAILMTVGPTPCQKYRRVPSASCLFFLSSLQCLCSPLSCFVCKLLLSGFGISPHWIFKSFFPRKAS